MREYKIKGMIFLLFVTIISCNISASCETKVVSPIQGMQSCDNSSNIVKLTLRDSEGNRFPAYWSPHAGARCPGPGFPRLIISHPKVKFWIHVIEVDIPYSYFAKEFHGWMQNLTDLNSNWVQLDLSESNRSNKVPFYNDARNPIFHDNPMWGGIPASAPFESRRWSGYLYGFETMKRDRPLVSIEWGFAQKKNNSSVKTIAPKQTDLRYWNLVERKLRENKGNEVRIP